MAVIGTRTYRFTVEIYRDGTRGSAADTETHVWDVETEDPPSAHKKIYGRAAETVRPLLDDYRVLSFELVVPKDPTHFHVDVHTGETPASVVGWGTAWAKLRDAVEDVAGSLGARTTGSRVAMVTCEDTACWT